MKKRLYLLAALCLILVLVLTPSRWGMSQNINMIVILTPGDGSQLTSPIRLEAAINPVDVALIRVALVDSSGNSLSRQLLRLEESGGQAVQFVTLLHFEIPTDHAQAILTLATYDESHRPIALRSSSLRLQSDGKPIILTNLPEKDWIAIEETEHRDTTTGMELIVKGTVVPLSSRPVFFDLIDDTGRVIGSRQLVAKTPGEPQDFSITVIYPHNHNTQSAQLVIRQASDSIPTDIILDRLPINLEP